MNRTSAACAKRSPRSERARALAESAAYHKAGHLVAQWLEGKGLESDHGVVLASGAVAEALHAGKRPRSASARMREDEDRRQYANCIGVEGREAERMWNLRKRWARRIYTANAWRAVEALAQAMLTGARMHEQTATRIIARAYSARP